MAKKKIVPEEIESSVEVVEEVKVEKVDEKDQLDSQKKTICEFYGIQDEELFSPECDLSKYGLNKQDEAVLLEWAKENKKVKSGDVVFDIYTTNIEAGAIIAKYGLSPNDVAEDNLSELSSEEKEIIKAYYNDLISKL